MLIAGYDEIVCRNPFCDAWRVLHAVFDSNAARVFLNLHLPQLFF